MKFLILLTLALALLACAPKQGPVDVWYELGYKDIYGFQEYPELLGPVHHKPILPWEDE